MSDLSPTCPKCGSTLVRFRPNRDDWICDDCDYRWTAAGQDMSDRTGRLFLSYARRDAKGLADRLRLDLERNGHLIWQDSREIRPGREWEHEIQDGLRSTQLVVAVLSPYAVRRNSDADNNDNLDSVCLDEISFARFTRPPRPIVPVMAVQCEPPLCIFRLDYVDLCAWRDSEDQYQAGLQRLLSAIDAALRGKMQYRLWDHRFRPWDFAAFLNEKRRNFCGRQWLFDEIDAWRATNQESALLITGDPGVGKSAFVAELVHRNPGGQVLAYHCCQADTPETLRPDRFVHSLAAMVASRLPGYAARLDDPMISEVLAEGNCLRDPGSAFEAGLLAPLETLSAPAEGVRYLLVDALDEALALREGQTIVELFASRLERLPKWLRLVATTRRERAVLDRMRGLRAREISAQDPRNLADVKTYLTRRLQMPDLAERLVQAGWSQQEAVDLICEKSEGNFLYVQQVLQGLERDLYSLVQLQTLPPGLPGLYFRFFSRNFPNESAYGPVRAVLEVLVAAREPLTVAIISEATGMDVETEAPYALRLLGGYLNGRENEYALYHKSLEDWLTEPSERGGPYAISSKLGNTRLAAALERGYAAGAHHLPHFALAHLLYHATCAGKEALVSKLITDASYLTARVVCGGTGSLIADVNLITHRLPALASQAAELIQVLSRRSSLLQQMPALTAQELVNQALVPETCEKLDTAKTEEITWAVDQRNMTTRKLSRILGPTDQQAVSLPPVVVHISPAPDGRSVVTTGSPPNGLRLWRIPSGEPVVCLLGHEAGVAEASFLPDGHQLLSASWDHHVILWDVRTAQMLANFHSHSEVINALAVSSDGRIGVSGAWDGCVALYDLANRAALGVLADNQGQINSLRLSPDGKYLLCGSGEGRVTLWDLPGRRCLRTWSGLGGGLLNCLDVDWGAQRALAVTLGGRLYLLSTGQNNNIVHAQIDEVPLERIVLLPAGTRAATGDGEGRLRLWKLPELVPDVCIQAHQGRLSALAVQNHTLLSGGNDHSVRSWTLPSLQHLWSIKTSAEVLIRAELSSEGEKWWGIRPSGKLLHGRPGETGRVVDKLAELGPAYSICGAGMDCIIVGSTKGIVASLDKSEWRWLKQLHRSAVTQLALCADGRLAASLDMTGELCIFDVTAGQLFKRVSGGPGTTSVCWGQSKSIVYWLDGNGRFCSFDTVTGNVNNSLFPRLPKPQGLTVFDEAGLAAVACESSNEGQSGGLAGTRLVLLELKSGSVIPIEFRFPIGVQRILKVPNQIEAVALGNDGGVVWLDLLARGPRSATQIPTVPLAGTLLATGELAILDAAGRYYRFG